MFDDIIVLNNVVSKNTQELIKDLLTKTTGGIPWFIKKDISSSTEKREQEIYVEAPGFVNVFFNKCGINNKELFELSIPIIKNSIEKLKLGNLEILYGRTFFQFPLTTHSGLTNPHTDLQVPHIVILYYVFDADGDTVFFNEKYTGKEISCENLKIIKKITPKQGTCVVFNGLNYHSTILPKENKRCVININLIEK